MFYDGDCGDVLACRGAIPSLARYLSAMEDNIIKSTKDFAVCSVCLVGTGRRKKPLRGGAEDEGLERITEGCERVSPYRRSTMRKCQT